MTEPTDREVDAQLGSDACICAALMDLAVRGTTTERLRALLRLAFYRGALWALNDIRADLHATEAIRNAQRTTEAKQ